MAKLLAIFIVLFWSQLACAQFLGSNLLIVEEGDDRLRPGLSLHGGMGEYKAELTLYGRKYGPILERTYILSASKKIDLFRYGELNLIKAGFGPAIMDETVHIDTPSERSKTEHSTNLGIVLGVSFEHQLTKPLAFVIDWQSYLFPAGPIGGIFLATGRKQTMGLGVRYYL